MAKQARPWAAALLPPLLWMPALAADAGWIEPELLSLRGGGGASTIPQSFDFRAIGLRGRLPWQDRWGAWTLRGHLDLDAGRLDSDGDHAELYTLGPSVSFSRGRITADAGISPSYINEDAVNGRQFGGGFQFTSHLGLYLELRRWSVGYRIQHTSNAHIYRDNDGVDLQMLDLWWRF